MAFRYSAFKYMWILAVLLTFLAGGCQSAFKSYPGGAHDWPQWRGPNGDGISHEGGWLAEFEAEPSPIAWQREIGVGYAAVSVSNGRLYTAGWNDEQSTIYCLDARTGNEIWTHTYAIKRYNKLHEGGPGATPAVDGDRVYALSREAELFCLDAKSGAEKWSIRLTDKLGITLPSWAFTGSPMIAGDWLYLDVGKIIAVEKTRGHLIWQSEDYGPAYSTPSMFTHGQRSLLATFPEHGLVVLDALTGREIAKHRWKTSYGVNAATPIVQNNDVFISSGYNAGAAVLRLEGEQLQEVWKSHEMRNQMASCVLVNNHLYGFDESQLKCMNFDTGDVIWSQRGLGKGTLMSADGRLIVLSEGGELIIAPATPEGFSPTGRAKVLDADKCWIMPVLANGNIYCRSATGTLVCVDVQDRGGPTSAALGKGSAAFSRSCPNRLPTLPPERTQGNPGQREE